MKTGRFITFEGGEGAGKSTQARMFADALRARGLVVVETREPGGTPGAERIRELLLATDGDGWGPRAEALLFAAARSDHVERLIRPAIVMGKWVVCDRFLDSSRAYQGRASGLGDEPILDLHRFGSEGLLPDLTLLIEASPKVAAERLARRDGDATDRIGGRGAAFHDAVAEAFAAIAGAERARVARVDGDGSAEETHRRVMAAAAPLIGDEP